LSASQEILKRKMKARNALMSTQGEDEDSAFD
jgi:hypothetical protein